MARSLVLLISLNIQFNLVYDLLRENGIQKARWMEAGAVISSHGGPGAIGITGIEK
jgi:fatty acid-binding protein DegV